MENLPLREVRWGVPDAFVAIIGSVIIAVGVGVVLVVTDFPLEVAILIGAGAPWLALAGWPLWATRGGSRGRGNGARIDLGIALSWSDVGWGALFGFAGLFAGGIGAVITAAIVGDFSSAAGEAAAELTNTSSFISLFIFAVMIAVGAPIVEELAFRGLLFNSLRKRGVGAIVTVLITAAVFTLFHFEPVRILVLLPIGITLGLARLKGKSLGAPMVAHGINNLPAAVALLIGLPEVTP